MFSKADYNIVTSPTERWGLLHEFSLNGAGQDCNDSMDWTQITKHCTPEGGIFSELNRKELKNQIKPWMKLIVEIGVSYHGYEESSTKVLVDNKPKDCIYYGIDIGDRNYVKDNGENVHLIQDTSLNIEKNLQLIFSHGHEYIDLLHIDGWHSVENVREEWNYAKYVRPNGGVIAIHDTNYHPGPCVLMKSIDKSCFKKILNPCEVENDYGFTILIRK